MWSTLQIRTPFRCLNLLLLPTLSLTVLPSADLFFVRRVCRARCFCDTEKTTNEQSKSTKRVKNFGPDLRDGEALSVLLTQLDPSVCDPCNEPPGSDARARHIIRNAKVRIFFEPVRGKTALGREPSASGGVLLEGFDE